jgi:hypothetical protein
MPCPQHLQITRFHVRTSWYLDSFEPYAFQSILKLLSFPR